MTDAVPVLWTGGWDSTFRVLQLLLVEQRAVQPIYIIDPERGSTLRELQSQDHIRQALSRCGQSATLRPRQVYVRTDFPVVPELADRHEALQRHGVIGRQYLWLASIAHILGWPRTELAIERSANEDPAWHVIFDGIGGPAPRLATRWEAELFAYWSFPLLHLSKPQMQTIAARHGFLDLLALRWTCFDPRPAGRSCGLCIPCRTAVREGATLGLQLRRRPVIWAHRFARGIAHPFAASRRVSQRLAARATGGRVGEHRPQ